MSRSRPARFHLIPVTAALVFGLCDGKRSVREIIRVLSECYPDGAASLSDDVLTTINELRENGVLAIG